MLRLILPIAFQQFMLALVSACDVVMLGRLSQTDLLSVMHLNIPCHSPKRFYQEILIRKH